MKHRVKFRVLEGSGPTGKIAVNLKEGEEFAFTDAVLGLPSSGAKTKAYCLVAVKQMTTSAWSGEDDVRIAVNGVPGTEFVLHPGDLLAVAGRTVEFIDVPEQNLEEAETFLDLEQLRTPEALASGAPIPSTLPPGTQVDLELSGRSIDSAHLATVLKEEFPDEPEEELEIIARLEANEEKEELEELGGLDNPEYDADSLGETEPASALDPGSAHDPGSVLAPELAPELAPATDAPLASAQAPTSKTAPASPAADGVDPEKLKQSRRWAGDIENSGFVRRRRNDRGRKIVLGALGAAMLGTLVFFFAIANQSKSTNRARLPSSLPKSATPEPAPPPAQAPELAGDPDDAKFNDYRKMISDSYIRRDERSRSLALENNSMASQFTKERTEFFSAVRYGDLDMVKKMITTGRVNPETIVESGSTALMQSSYYGQIEITKYLVSRKVNLNDADPTGQTALMYAARARRFETVQYLLSRGADPLAKTREGEQAIDFARRAKHDRMVAVLTKAMSTATAKAARVLASPDEGDGAAE